MKEVVVDGTEAIIDGKKLVSSEFKKVNTIIEKFHGAWNGVNKTIKNDIKSMSSDIENFMKTWEEKIKDKESSITEDDLIKIKLAKGIIKKELTLITDTTIKLTGYLKSIDEDIFDSSKNIATKNIQAIFEELSKIYLLVEKNKGSITGYEFTTTDKFKSLTKKEVSLKEMEFKVGDIPKIPTTLKSYFGKFQNVYSKIEKDIYQASIKIEKEAKRLSKIEDLSEHEEEVDALVVQIARLYLYGEICQIIFTVLAWKKINISIHIANALIQYEAEVPEEEVDEDIEDVDEDDEDIESEEEEEDIEI